MTSARSADEFPVDGLTKLILEVGGILLGAVGEFPPQATNDNKATTKITFFIVLSPSKGSEWF
jgi:hypothetical protein